MQAWVNPFLDNLTASGNVSKSARACGISSSTAYALRNSDADFGAAWEQALEDHIDVCEEELTRRGLGYESLVLYQGQPVPVYERDEIGQVVQRVVAQLRPDGSPTQVIVPVQAKNPDGTLRFVTEIKHSDQLLLAKVKGYRRDRYAERSEHTGADGGPLEMDDGAKAARLLAILESAKSRKFNDEIA